MEIGKTQVYVHQLLQIAFTLKMDTDVQNWYTANQKSDNKTFSNLGYDFYEN